MTTPDPTDTPTSSDTNIKGALLNQLLAGPSYPEVAAALLRDALKELYPTLDIDPYTTVVGEPAWDIVGGELIERPTRYQSLCDLLVLQSDRSKPTLLVDGLHYLTQLPLTVPEVHLPVRIDQIGRLINELAPAMLQANQEQQLAYWNAPFGSYGPRWHELSSTLRKLWDVKQVKGWTATECDMARQLFLYPDPQDRNDKYDSHAYLIDIERVNGDQANQIAENSLVVLIGSIDNKEVILAHSLVNGYEKFESRQALGQSLTAHLGSFSRPSTIRWRLYEPSGNIFDSKACGIIAIQVKIVGTPYQATFDLLSKRTTHQRTEHRAWRRLVSRTVTRVATGRTGTRPDPVCPIHEEPVGAEHLPRWQNLLGRYPPSRNMRRVP
ncbi:hypothetical protein THH46_31340 [Pseudomonas sp. NA13]